MDGKKDSQPVSQPHFSLFMKEENHTCVNVYVFASSKEGKVCISFTLALDLNSCGKKESALRDIGPSVNTIIVYEFFSCN